MNYTGIDMDRWHRAPVYRHFIQDVRCVISVTAEIDVSELVSFCEKEKHRFYPAFLYVVSRVLNKREEFRLGYDTGGQLILWDNISPSYIVFHPQDEQFTRLVSEYNPDFSTFYTRITQDMEKNKDKRGFEISYPQKNTFDASCLPWLSYTACGLHVFDSGCYLAPVVTWGRYEKKDGALCLPLSIQIHHAVADGFHVARFFDDVSAEISALAGAGHG